jgi:predicted glycosyltransferase
MGGYNTICEILSLQKRAIIAPRVKPVQEQWIRAQKMAELGYFKTIHPDDLTANLLLESLVTELGNTQPIPNLDLEGLPQITHYLTNLIQEQFYQSTFLRAIAS